MSVAGLLEMDTMLHAAVRTEFTKLRRCKVTWLTFLVYAFMAVMAGFFMWMLGHPGLAESLGLLGQKVNFAFGGEELDWSTFLGFLRMMGGIGGLMVLSFIVTFVFGREYAELTAKNMLALPLPRPLFALAKLVVAAVWFAALNAWLVGLGLLVGRAVGLPGYAPELFRDFAEGIFATALLVFCTGPLVAWVAVASRGYFAPLGYAIFTLVLASVFGHTGWAPWCPWSIVGISCGAAGPAAGSALGAGSHVVMACTFALGMALTMLREARADNAQ